MPCQGRHPVTDGDPSPCPCPRPASWLQKRQRERLAGLSQSQGLQTAEFLALLAARFPLDAEWAVHHDGATWLCSAAGCLHPISYHGDEEDLGSDGDEPGAVKEVDNACFDEAELARAREAVGASRADSRPTASRGSRTSGRSVDHPTGLAAKHNCDESEPG